MLPARDLGNQISEAWGHRMGSLDVFIPVI